MYKYKKLHQVGEGAHGVVFKAVVIASASTAAAAAAAAPTAAAAATTELSSSVPATQPESSAFASTAAAAAAAAASSSVPRTPVSIPKQLVLSGPTPVASASKKGEKRKLADASGDGDQKAPKKEKDDTASASTSAAGIKSEPTAAASATAAAGDTKHALIDSKSGGTASSAVGGGGGGGMGCDLPLDTFVAIKKIRMRAADDGLSMEAIREIKILQELTHPHVIRVYDMFNHYSNIHVVMEYMEFDLEHVIKDSQHIILTPGDVKQYMIMLLAAVEHCHKRWILHRDIKPGNLLIARGGGMKLADFGLAKFYGSPDRELSNQACTLWYRAPELLFGAKSYGTGADIWSVGCIFAELMLRVPLFPGTGEIDQLSRIFACLGTPKEEDWPGMVDLPGYMEFESSAGTDLKAMFQAYGPEALSLLRSFFVYNPSKRCTAAEALAHPYFRSSPAPTPIEKLPVLPPKPVAAKKSSAFDA